MNNALKLVRDAMQDHKALGGFTTHLQTLADCGRGLGVALRPCHRANPASRRRRCRSATGGDEAREPFQSCKKRGFLSYTNHVDEIFERQEEGSRRLPNHGDEAGSAFQERKAFRRPSGRSSFGITPRPDIRGAAGCQHLCQLQPPGFEPREFRESGAGRPARRAPGAGRRASGVGPSRWDLGTSLASGLRLRAAPWRGQSHEGGLQWPHAEQ